MKALKSLMIMICCTVLVACIDVDERSDSRDGNYDALWTIMDEHYCYFDYKKTEYGLDWNNVYAKYKGRADTVKTVIEQFDVFSDMLDELRDGHVNLVSDFNFYRYWDWKEGYPENFSDSILRRYIGTDYYMAGGLKYCILRDSIAYLRCESFSSSFSENNLSYALFLMSECPALILDLRNNGGGNLTLAERLSSRFTEEKILTGYMRHKTGKGHSDFSDYEARYIEPSSGVRWTKPIIVLTNRGVFSAANECVNELRCCPNVTVVGDRTGGGGGLPFTSELPNGWTVRFSACPMYDKNKKDIEFGIEPDYKVDITSDDYQKGVDTILEFAFEYIINILSEN
ncbi:MAG: S41 family peptidase [Bacteroidaceae bacterium]|nr:S41 family peptidase [Bacteroidaceae bacterium]